MYCVHSFIHSLIQSVSQPVKSFSEQSTLYHYIQFILILKIFPFQFGLGWFGLDCFDCASANASFIIIFFSLSSVPSHTHSYHIPIHIGVDFVHTFPYVQHFVGLVHKVFFLLRLISICVSNCNEVKHKWIYIVCDFGWCEQLFSRSSETKASEKNLF